MVLPALAPDVVEAVRPQVAAAAVDAVLVVASFHSYSNLCSGRPMCCELQDLYSGVSDGVPPMIYM